MHQRLSGTDPGLDAHDLAVGDDLVQHDGILAVGDGQDDGLADQAAELAHDVPAL